MTKSAGIRSFALGLLALLVWTGTLFAQGEKLPPQPATYVTDQAGVLDAGTAQTLNDQLAQFERDTSNQILVVIYPSLPDGQDVDQYSIDTFNSWGVGQKGKDNGAVLFIYYQNHRMFICTGRGLEGALPDATCKNIISQVITPAFRRGDYTGGVQAGINAMIAATKGEYQGTGRTNNEMQQQDSGGGSAPVWFIVLFILLILISSFFRSSGFGGPFIYSGGGWGGGGFGGGGGGFGGFSGGGGGSAGGGAGGGW